jgi:hypothetical protein
MGGITGNYCKMTNIPLPYNIFTITISLFFFYAAFFLYEDEEKTLQNKLENWWLRLNYFSQNALSRHTFIAKKIIFSINNFINRLFGKKLFSIHACLLSLCFSFASFGLISSYIVFNERYSDQISISWWSSITKEKMIFTYLAIFIFYSLLILISLKIKFLFQKLIFLLVVLGSTILILIFGRDFFSYIEHKADYDRSNWLDQGPFVVSILLAVVYDLFFVTIIRKILLITYRLNSLIIIILVMIANFVLAFIMLFGATFFVDFIDKKFEVSKIIPGTCEYHDFSEPIGVIVASTNLFSILFSVLFFCFALILLLHRLAWPILSRPIYAVSRFGIFRHRKILALIGLTLLTASISPAIGIIYQFITLFSPHMK